MKLKTSVVLITGASRGIGRAMAVELARSGAKLALVARCTDQLEETSKLIKAEGADVLLLTADVRIEREVSSVVEKVVKHYGHIDVLVNNAGIMVGEMPFTEISPLIWQEILDTNLKGAFLYCHAVIPHMIKQSSGVIINVSSGAAVRTGVLNIPYCVSKAALDRLTVGLADELEEKGISCLSLCPPPTTTDTVLEMFPDRDFTGWAQPPENTAIVLRSLLENDLCQHSGVVVAVTDYFSD